MDIFKAKMFPAVFVKDSRSKPFKEQSHSRTTIDSTGNNYSPFAKDLKISVNYSLPFRKNNLQIEDILKDPPSLKFKKQTESRPQSPLAQKTKQNWQVKCNDRYVYYITDIVKDEEVCDFNDISKVSLTNADALRFKMALKCAVMDYILKDHKEIERLQLAPCNPLFPVTIRAPVPWSVKSSVEYLNRQNPLFFELLKLQNAFSELNSLVRIKVFDGNLGKLFTHLKLALVEWKLGVRQILESTTALTQHYDMLIDIMLKDSMQFYLGKLSNEIIRILMESEFSFICTVNQLRHFQADFTDNIGKAQLFEFLLEIDNLIDDVQFKRKIEITERENVDLMKKSFLELFRRIEAASVICHDILHPYSTLVEDLFLKIDDGNTKFEILGLEILDVKYELRQIFPLEIVSGNIKVCFKNIIDEWLDKTK